MTVETTHKLLLILLAVVAAAACSDGRQRTPDDGRDRALEQAFALSDQDPALAATLFAEAGPGPSLEAARMTVWAACLERIDAAPTAWRRYLEDNPPEHLAVRARLALIERLLRDGAVAEAVTERPLLPIDKRTRADELLLGIADPVIRLDAASRLVVSSPSFLATTDRDLDQRLTSRLSRTERLERAAAWRRDGLPARAAAELRREKWSGADERQRRRELARADLDVGSPGRALSVLPSGRDAEAEDHLLRAQAFRNRAWQLFPDRGDRRYFTDCVAAADSALSLEPASDLYRDALVLRLECATQVERLVLALESWQRLEATRWEDPRRDWLGRRLGVALARTGASADAVGDIARSLPIHERCLRYWTVANRADREVGLGELAAAGIADLYGSWSREALALPDVGIPRFAAPMQPADPPASIHLLLSTGLKAEALMQWRRVRQWRPPLPAEALAAAELAAEHGSPTDSIQWLLAGFPELGTIDMDLAPEDAVRAYLPLRWQQALRIAARESGLDPWLIAGVARQESGFAAHAESPRGAIGVLQLLPSTARLHARALGLGPQPDLRDPELNLRVGARELASLMRRFGSVEPALAAYNAGLTRVREWWKRWPERARFTEEIPVPETYNYVRRVVFLAEAYRLVYEEEWKEAP